jgi:hypothetical protein
MSMSMNRRSVWLALVLAAPASAWAGHDSDMTGRRELQMLQCPSAAPGASTRVERTRDGVTLVVTAPTEFTRREIQRRAAAQQALAARRGRGREEHTGQGTGSGRYGYCPGMLAATTVTVRNRDDGARIVVRARDADTVAELQRSTQARLARLRALRQSAKR